MTFVITAPDTPFAAKPLACGLYPVAMPIGNLWDISVRALFVLQKSSLILCEDTRVTRRILQAYDIHTPVQSYHAHNEQDLVPQILARLQNNEAIALVSDAGTPLISDPGFPLVQACEANKIPIIPIVGASAVLAALTGSGLPAYPFSFLGFAPTRSAARKNWLKGWATVPSTLVWFEAPHRIAASLRDAAEVLGGNRKACLARELTKRFEEFLHGSLADLAGKVLENPPKGEMVILVEGYTAPTYHLVTENSEDTIGEILDTSTPLSGADITNRLQVLLETHSVKQAASMLASETGLPKRTLYTMAVAIKDYKDPS